jgi:hypothetical protein
MVMTPQLEQMLHILSDIMLKTSSITATFDGQSACNQTSPPLDVGCVFNEYLD